MIDVAVIIATTGERPAMLARELASIDVAKLVAFSHGFSTDVIVERDPKRTGVAPTLLRGLARSKARFTTFWGDDDLMLPDYLWAHLRLAEDEGLDVVSNSYRRADEALNPTSEWHLPVATMADFLDGRCTVNDGALVRSSARVPFRPERGRAMMLTFWMDMLAAGRRFGTISEPYWYYRRHPGQLSASWSEAEMALREAAIDEHRAVAA